MHTSVFDYDALERLERKLKYASLDTDSQRELLEDLGFVLRPASWQRVAYWLDSFRSWVVSRLVWVRRVDISVMTILISAVFLMYIATAALHLLGAPTGAARVGIFSALPLATGLIAIVGISFALHRWSVGQVSRAVDEAMKRKEITNKMIVDHASLLIPFVGSSVLATDLLAKSAAHSPEDKVKISMFVYAELDNLEFVFSKCRVGLMEWEYALRAIGIFLARSQNPHFASRARRLVTEGRYSPDFTEMAEKLIAVSQIGSLRARRHAAILVQT